ncbi:MAG TPA: type I-E CRISPR-associated protein Cas6/Cse3/CasE [Fimbriimonas sp.]
MSRLELKADAAERPAFWREVSSPGGAHRALWAVFSRSPEQSRDFLFRRDEGGPGGAGRVRFFVLSKHPPASDDDGIWSIETRPFAPVIKAGDRLAFSLRASPTVKRPARETGGEKSARGRRHDVIRDQVLRSVKGGEPIDVAEAVRVAGMRWLSAKADQAGFDLPADAPAETDDGMPFAADVHAPLRIGGYRRHRIYRSGAKPILFSTLDFEGVLVVREPARFVEQVASGFGPQKAFGCGLMLLRRA